MMLFCGLLSGAPPGPAVAPADLHEVELFPGRGEVGLRFTPAGGGAVSEKILRSGDDDRTLRAEPGNSYLFPASLWDRFAGSRRGPFRIRVSTREDEVVWASGREVGRWAGGPGRMVTEFVGDEADRGVGLYVISRTGVAGGAAPAAPVWTADLLPSILAALERRFGVLQGSPPRVAVLDFPTPVAKSFPGLLVLDDSLAGASLAPPAGQVAILAHEAAHLWWGNHLRVKGDGAAALQEGLAEFGAARVLGELLGPAAEAAHWKALRDEYLLASEAMAGAGVNLISGDDRPFGRALRYARSAWTIRMLEARVGAAALRVALASLSAAGAPVGWNDLLTAAGAAAGTELEAFEQGWLLAAGHPHLQEERREPAGDLWVRNSGSGGGEVAVELLCSAKPPQRRHLAIPPGTAMELPETSGCTVNINPGGDYLHGEPGPPAATGVVLGRAWGHPVVRSVAAGSAAARAGLRPGDLVLAADGQPQDEADVRSLMNRLRVSGPVHLRLRRGKQTVEALVEGGGR